MVVPDIHFGVVDESEFDWRQDDLLDMTPDDDEELSETPPDVVKLLGFDPLEEDLEKTNPCHNKSDGRFCSTSGSGASGRFKNTKEVAQAIVDSGFAGVKGQEDFYKVDLGDLSVDEAEGLLKVTSKLRERYPKAEAIGDLRVEDMGPGKREGQLLVAEYHGGPGKNQGFLVVNSRAFRTQHEDSLDVVLTHEYGHHLQSVLRSGGPGGDKNLSGTSHGDVAMSVWNDRRNWKLTKYARTNPGEMVSEAFVDFELNGGKNLTGALAPLKGVFKDWQKNKKAKRTF